MQRLTALYSVCIVVMLEQQQREGRFMATDKNQRETLKAIAKDMGGQFVEVPRQWAFKDSHGALTLLGDDIKDSHRQLMILKSEKENQV